MQIGLVIHLSVIVGIFNVQSIHGTYNGDKRLYCITVDNWFEHFVVFLSESTFVNNPAAQIK